MELKNSYYWSPTLTPDQCEQILFLGKEQLRAEEQSGKSTEASTFGQTHKQAMPSTPPRGEKTFDEIKAETGLTGQELERSLHIRDTKVTWLREQWIYDLILPKLHKINKLAGWNFDIDYYENFQFAEYNKGGFYGWHNDGGSDRFAVYKRYIPGVSQENENERYVQDPKMVGKIRKLSLTINLNRPGEYEGGNLKFDFGPHATNNRYHECVEIRPQGNMIVFPSFVHHTVTPVTRGTRYSLVLWSLGNPFK